MVIGYDMIIFRELMVQLCLLAEFKNQSLQWYGKTVPTKEPLILLEKIHITSHYMREMVMQIT